MIARNNVVFIDVNSWLNDTYLKEINNYLGESGELINLRLKKKKFNRKTDEEIFKDLTNRYSAKNTMIWVITRDQKMPYNVPASLSNNYLVICGKDKLSKYKSELNKVVLVILIIKNSSGARAYVLNIEIKNIIQCYIIALENLEIMECY